MWDETAQGRSHPVLYSVQESYERLRTTLKALPRRHAVITIGNHFETIETVEIPAPRTSQEELARLKEGFAQRLLTPKERAVALVDGGGKAPDEPPPFFDS